MKNIMKIIALFFFPVIVGNDKIIEEMKNKTSMEKVAYLRKHDFNAFTYWCAHSANPDIEFSEESKPILIAIGLLNAQGQPIVPKSKL